MNEELQFDVSKVIVNDNIIGCIVRPQSVLKFNDTDFFVEVVRKVPNWKEKLTQKFVRYETVI